MKRLLLHLLLFSPILINAQFWTEKATGFTTPSRSLNSISIVDSNVIWANAFDNTAPLSPVYTIREFTKSIDGGNTWVAGSVNLGANSNDMGTSTISAVSATTAWVSVSPGAVNTGGIWKTMDAGLTWNKQATALFSGVNSYPNFVHFWDANTGIAQGDPDGGEFEIYTTTNGGTTWTRVAGANIPDPSPIGGEYGYFNQFKVSGNTIWFGTSTGRIYRSSDKGLTWTVHSTPSADFGLDRFTFSNATNGLLMKYNSVTLYSTNDGGTSWSAAPISTTGQVFNTNIAFIPGTTKVVSAAYANPTGSSYSLDNGVNWITVDNGVFHGELVFLNENFGFSAGINTNATTGGISKYSGIPLKATSFDLNNQITAYPNPTNGILHLNNGSDRIKKVSVHDVQGKQVYDSKPVNDTKMDLDLKSLQAGEYLIKISSDGEKSETKKIIKN